MTEELEPGKRYRVSYEGEAFDRSTLRTSDGLVVGISYATSVERLPDPEPEWEPGDVVRAADGRVFAYARDTCASLSWCFLGEHSGTLRWYDDAEVPRPLTPLVRDGKPWGAS